MRRFWVFCVLLVSFSRAVAVVDPDPDQIGVYFDVEANVTCTTVQPIELFSAYVILTNPTSELYGGIELSVCAEVTNGDPYCLALIAENWPMTCAPHDYGIHHLCEDGQIVGCVVPTALNGDTHIVVELVYVILEMVEVSFFIGPDSSDLDGDGLPGDFNYDSVVPLGISSGGTDIPVAKVNGECNVVGSERQSFGGLKALYR